MSGPATKRLTRALDEIRHRERYPYGHVVTAALRSFGVPVDEREAPEEDGQLALFAGGAGA